MLLHSSIGLACKLLVRIWQEQSLFSLNMQRNCKLTPAVIPTYMCVGENDGIASWRIMESRANTMQAAGIGTELHKYPGLGHGFGIGTGTAAEGWLDDAVAFWEKQIIK